MSDDDRIAEILGDWRERLDEGEPLDPEEVIRAHPDLEEPLRARFHALALLEAALTPESVKSPPLRPLSDDRYAEFEPCGEGGMGIVYWALDRDLNRGVAFKIVRPDGKMDQDRATPPAPLELLPPKAGTSASHAFDSLRARFLQEAWVTAGLEHPGILPVYELGETPEGVPYYTMRFVRGSGTLDRAIEAASDLPERIRLLEPFLRVCDAIGYAHSRGVIHRDLKPAHVALGEFGEVVVLDWGLAKVKGTPDLTSDLLKRQIDEYREASDLKTATRALGTPGYMSPEAALGRTAEVDERSDVYSLGAILYQVLTGRPPFTFETWGELIRQLRAENPPAPSQVDPRVPEGLSRICVRALSRSREDRYEAVHELAAGIRAWQTESAIDSEVTTLLRDAEAALAGIDRLPGEPLACQLDRITALASRARQLRPDHTHAEHVFRRMEEVREGITQAREKHARSRLLRRLLWPALALLIIGAGVVLLLDLRRREAVAERAEAAAALRSARALALAQASEIVQPTDPMLSLLLAREAARTQILPATLSRLRGAIAGSLTRAVARGHTARVNSAVFSPDGEMFLTASDDETARLWDLRGRERVVLSGHEDRVRGAGFSPDGRRVVTASDDMTARVWALDGRELAVLTGHEGYVISAAFSPDGTRVLTASWDQTARVWSAEGESLAELRGHAGELTAAVFMPDGKAVLTGSADGTAGLWDLEGRRLATFLGHADPVTFVAASPDGKRVLTSSSDGTSRIFDLVGKERAVLASHEGRVCCGIFSGAGDRIATSTSTGNTRVWDEEGYELAVLRGHEGQVNGAVFSPAGDRLATAGDDGTVRVWNSTGDAVAVLRGHLAEVGSAVFSPDGAQILTASADGTARLWDSATREQSLFIGHRDEVESACFSPAGDKILTASDDRTARIWDLDGRQILTLEGHEGVVTSAVFSPSGSAVATACWDSVVRLYDSAGEPIRVFRGHQGGIWSAEFSADGRHILTASEDGTARVFAVGGETTAVLEHESNVWFAAFSPGQDRVVTACADGNAYLWDLSGLRLATLEGHSGPVVSATFSRDGALIATASWDGTARLWDSEGHEIAVLSGHDGEVESAVFSPDGRLVLTASSDLTARLWDTEGREVAMMRGHTDRISLAIFSPAGDRILTAAGRTHESRDHTARLWDLEGKVLGILRGHSGRINAAAFTPDGRLVLTASPDGTARTWLTERRDLVPLADHRITRSFDPEERKRYADLLPR